MRSPAAFLGLFALLAATIIFMAGTGGGDARAESGATKWIISGALIGIAAAWIVAMIVDATRRPASPHDDIAADDIAADDLAPDAGAAGRRRRVRRKDPGRSPAAFLGLFALIIAAILVIAGTGGTEAGSERDRLIVGCILIGIAVAWIVAMIVDATRPETPRRRATRRADSRRDARRREPLRSPVTFLGPFALLVATLLFVAGAGGGDTRVESGATKWIVAVALLGVAVAWIVAVVVDATRHPGSEHHAAEAEAEAAAAAHDDRRESRRSRMAHDGLDRLAALLEQGAITQAEYDAKKDELLRDL